MYKTIHLVWEAKHGTQIYETRDHKRIFMSIHFTFELTHLNLAFFLKDIGKQELNMKVGSISKCFP